MIGATRPALVRRDGDYRRGNSGRKRYRLSKPRTDGGTALRLTPLELIARLAALIPPPRRHRHRYHGVLTPNSPYRAQVRALGRGQAEQKEVCREIERRTKDCNDVKAAIKSQIATLTTYRTSLIHECVTGERRITEAEVAATKRTETDQPRKHQI